MYIFVDLDLLIYLFEIFDLLSNAICEIFIILKAYYSLYLSYRKISIN